MNNVTEAVATIPPALTPEALNNLLRITAPAGSVTVKGIAAEVHYRKKPGEEHASKIYGRLGGLSIWSNIPGFRQLRNRWYTVHHGPKLSGMSRHAAPEQST